MGAGQNAAGYGQGPGGYGGPGGGGYGGPPGQPPGGYGSPPSGGGHGGPPGGGGYGGPPGHPPGGYYGPPGQQGYGPPGQQQGYGPPGYGQQQRPQKKGNGCMIALGVVGALAVIAGGGLWFVFHSASNGEPCKVSGALVYRDCESDNYCVRTDELADGTCMTESEGKAACARSTGCKADGKCDLDYTSGACE